MRAFFLRGNLVWLTILVWLGFATLAVILTLQAGGPSLMTDDAMRLAQVRDLLSGQSWFDVTQWRMNTPYGLAMHWTRPVDAGIAGLVLAFRLFVDPQAAETATLYVWPLLSFLAVLLALARIAKHLGGDVAGVIVLVLAVTCVNVFGHFSPGAIDHHNVMIALTLWTMVFLLEAEKPWSGVWAALTCTASLAIGMETLPYVAAALGIVAFLWFREGAAQFARRFGITLAIAAFAVPGIMDARYRLTPACDTYSSFYAILLGAGGAGLAAITYFARTRIARVGALVVVGVAAMTLAGLCNANCFLGPYAAMDPRLNAIWLSRITEAQSAFFFAHYATSEFVASYVYAAAGTLAAIALWISRRDFSKGVLCAFACMALLVATVEIRAVGYAILIGLPAIALLLTRLVHALAKRGVLAPIAVSVALIASCDASFAVVGGTLVESNTRVTARVAGFEAETGCGSPQGLAPLAKLPLGRVAAFVDQGPAVLAYTKDAAIAGPYHRDAEGILDTYAIFTGDAEAAKAVLERRRINYLMVCTASRDWNYYLAQGGPNGLLARIAADRMPAWLIPAGTDATGRVTVYKVARAVNR
jgi:hypothetical protein